jgi:hypothetical protein
MGPGCSLRIPAPRTRPAVRPRSATCNRTLPSLGPSSPCSYTTLPAQSPGITRPTTGLPTCPGRPNRHTLIPPRPGHSPTHLFGGHRPRTTTHHLFSCHSPRPTMPDPSIPFHHRLHANPSPVATLFVLPTIPFPTPLSRVVLTLPTHIASLLPPPVLRRYPTIASAPLPAVSLPDSPVSPL